MTTSRIRTSHVRTDDASIFASLATGERIAFEKDGGNSVLLFTPGVPGTVHIKTVRRFDACGTAIAFDADSRWSMHYQMTGHDCTIFEGQYDDEAAAAAAWLVLKAKRPDFVVADET